MAELQRATDVEIATAVGVLIRNMPAPRGVKTTDRMEGYLNALRGFPLAAIEAGIAKFLRGECPELSQKYCPHPPEVAGIVRASAAKLGATVLEGEIVARSGRLFRYRAPRSKVLERRCTKSWAWNLIGNGVHPYGSIWVPGPIGERPDVGDLYAPDADWELPTPWPPDDKGEESRTDESVNQRREPIRDLYAARDFSEPRREDLPLLEQAPRQRSIPDFSKDKIEISDKLQANLDERKTREATDRRDRGESYTDGGT